MTKIEQNPYIFSFILRNLLTGGGQYVSTLLTVTACVVNITRVDKYPSETMFSVG